MMTRWPQCLAGSYSFWYHNRRGR